MIKVLIIEDEQIAAEKLQKMLLETDDNIEVVAIKGYISKCKMADGKHRRFNIP